MKKKDKEKYCKRGILLYQKSTENQHEIKSKHEQKRKRERDIGVTKRTKKQMEEDDGKFVALKVVDGGQESAKNRGPSAREAAVTSEGRRAASLGAGRPPTQGRAAGAGQRFPTLLRRWRRPADRRPTAGND